MSDKPTGGATEGEAGEDTTHAGPAEMIDRHAVPGSSSRPPTGEEIVLNKGVDRGVIIREGLKATALWSMRVLVTAVCLAALLWLLAQLWVGVLPLLLALIVSTVLWKPTAWLRRHGIPAALAAIAVIVGGLLVVVGVMAAIAPSVVGQGTELANTATRGLDDVQRWVSEPPLNMHDSQVAALLDQATGYLQQRGGQIASGVFSGVSVLGNVMVTLVLVLVLTFFFLKDGSGFLPMVRRWTGRSAGRHLTEVGTRCWNTLGGFVRTQAVVSAVDAFFIGVGLLLLSVPLALPLAVLTFFGGFIPIVGAFAVGALAVLVALVSNGFGTAIAVLVLIIAVQQLEGNVLQPFLQGKSMQLHAGVILLAVAAGGTQFGITGAFLAVPVAASVAVVLRYISEQIDLRTGDLLADQVRVATPDGAVSAEFAEQAAARYADQSHDSHVEPAPQTPEKAPASRRVSRVLLSRRKR